MQTDYKYIHFEMFFHRPKTTVWTCRNTKSDVALGLVEYDTGWRQYIFKPNENTQFSVGCMKDIIHFIGQLEAERKEAVRG